MTTAAAATAGTEREAAEAEIRRRVKVSAAGFRLVGRHRRAYEIKLREGWTRVPGVTSVLGVLDKSRPLMTWATRIQIEADIRAAWKAYRGGLPEGLAEQEFSDLFREHSEREAAWVKERNRATDIGNQLHAMIEHRSRKMLGCESSEPVGVSDDARFLMVEWERWAEAAEFRPVLTEFPVYSVRYRYAGTADMLAWVRPLLADGRRGDSRLWLNDWKSSNDFYGEHDLQNVAYRSAAVEMGLLDSAVGGLLVRIPKQASDPLPFEERVVDPALDETRLSVFRALLDVYPWKVDDDRAGLERWKARKARERSG